jgi:hypothetical protein
MKQIIPAVMPPLLPEERTLLTSKSSYSGEACVSEVLKYCQMKEINTSVPHIDEGVDILIEESRNKWKSAQVKKIGFRFRHGAQRYEFKFQGDNTEYSDKDIDVFFHVLMTHYRTLIWQSDSKYVPRRKNGSFVKNTNLILDRPKAKLTPSAKCQFQEKPVLLYAMYHPTIIIQNLQFFNPSSTSIEQYI